MAGCYFSLLQFSPCCPRGRCCTGVARPPVRCTRIFPGAGGDAASGAPWAPGSGLRWGFASGGERGVRPSAARTAGGRTATKVKALDSTHAGPVCSWGMLNGSQGGRRWDRSRSACQSTQRFGTKVRGQPHNAHEDNHSLLGDMRRVSQYVHKPMWGKCVPSSFLQISDCRRIPEENHPQRVTLTLNSSKPAAQANSIHNLKVDFSRKIHRYFLHLFCIFLETYTSTN